MQNQHQQPLQLGVVPGSVSLAGVAALSAAEPVPFVADSADIMPGLVPLIRYTSPFLVENIPVEDGFDDIFISSCEENREEIEVTQPVELRSMKPVSNANSEGYISMYAKVRHTKLMPKSPLLKLSFSNNHLPLMNAIYYFTKGSKNGFYCVPFHLQDASLRKGIDDHTVTLSFNLSFTIYIEDSVYPKSKLGMDTINNLNSLLDLVAVPKLTKYQWSDNQFYSPPTVSSFYSMITENTSRNFNDPTTEPLSITQIEKTLMPFQVDSLKWMLSHEGKTLNIENNEVNVENSLYPESPDSDELSEILETITPGWRRIEFLGNCKDEYWFNPFNGALCTTSCALKFLKSINFEKYPAKGFLCEEMGLGKTLEITSLIKLNPRSPESIPTSPIADILDPSRQVQACKTTLILCPETIINQWKDEISNTCPDMDVCVYQGITHLESLDPNATPTTVAKTLSTYDVVLTSYNLLGREVDRAAFIPTSRPKRKSSGHERIDYSSPLMLLQFHRLVLDEAQLASLSITRVAYFARIIPRVHTWCVSGTLIRKDLNDLHCLIKSQRMYPLDLLNLQQWSSIPRFFFDRLFKRICLRHTKEMVGNQVNLPKQCRIMLRSPFSTIESDNYQNLFNRFLDQVGLTETGEPIGEGFDYDRSKSGMRTWSSKLRMACCHALLNGTQIRHNLQLDSSADANGDFGSASGSGFAKKDKKKNSDLMIGTLDDVLNDLISSVEQEAATTFSNYIKNYTRMGKINEFLRNPSESVKIFNAIILEIQNKLTYYQNLDNSNSISGSKSTERALRVRNLLEYLHQAYFMLASAHYQHYRPMKPLPGNFSELIEMHNAEKAADDDNGDGEDEEKVVDVETLTEEERKHYVLENELYKKADEVLNQILVEPLKKCDEMITRLELIFSKYDVYEVEKIPELKSNQINLNEDPKMEIKVEDKSDVDKNQNQSIKLHLIANYFDDHSDFLDHHATTLGVSFILERAKEAMNQLNEQTTIINYWFEKLFEYQSVSVTKKEGNETTGEEYKSHLLLQEYSQAYVDQLQLILDDREKCLNSTEDNISFKNNASKISRSIRNVDLLHDDRFQKSSGDKQLYEQLESLRKFYIPQGTLNARYSLHTSILELIGEMQGYQQGSVEHNQLDQLVHFLKGQMKEHMKNVKQMKSKVFDTFNDTFNSKVTYFKSLQIRSDALVNYFPEKLGASPRYVAMVELEELKKEIELNRSKLCGLNARINYLSGLNTTRFEDDKTIAGDDEDEDDFVTDDSCVICRFRILVGTLTPCGHTYCRECLKDWMDTRPICPMCQQKLRPDELYNFTYSRGGLKGGVVESLQNDENGGGAGNEDKVNGEEEIDADQTLDQERLKLLKNRRTFEKDLDFVYQGLPNSDLREISSIKLKKSYGTKVDMIIRQAKYLVTKEPGSQILIFSQWNNFLLLLGRAMKNEDVTYRSWMDQKIVVSNKMKKDGKGSKLNEDIVDFKRDNTISCFLLNTVAQAAGLTFTNASHVFLCEPIVNLSFELQAINRIHRIGQTKETKVWNFIIEGTIEESIAYLGTKKRIQAARVRRNVAVNEESGGEREREIEEIDENVLEAKEMTKIGDVDKKEGEVISDDDLWAAFFAAKSAEVIKNVYN